MKNINNNPAGHFDVISCVPYLHQRKKGRVCLDYDIYCVNRSTMRGILITVTHIGDILNWCKDNTLMSQKISGIDNNFTDVKFVIVGGELRASLKDIGRVKQYVGAWLPLWVNSRLRCQSGIWNSVMLDIRKRRVSDGFVGGTEKNA